MHLKVIIPDFTLFINNNITWDTVEFKQLSEIIHFICTNPMNIFQLLFGYKFIVVIAGRCPVVGYKNKIKIRISSVFGSRTFHVFDTTNTRSAGSCPEVNKQNLSFQRINNFTKDICSFSFRKFIGRFFIRRKN